MHGLAVRGPEAGSDVVVLTLDVEDDHRVGPVQQVWNDDTDPFAAARRCGQHDRELAWQTEEATAVASDQDRGSLDGVASLVSWAAVAQEPRMSDFARVGEARVAMQGSPGSRGGDQGARQHDQRADAGDGDRGDQLLVQRRVVGVEAPVVHNAGPAGLPGIGLVQHQEQGAGQVDGRGSQHGNADQDRDDSGHLARPGPRGKGERRAVAHGSPGRSSRSCPADPRRCWPGL